jgi:hypothetical protein
MDHDAEVISRGVGLDEARRHIPCASAMYWTGKDVACKLSAFGIEDEEKKSMQAHGWACLVSPRKV